MKTKAILLFCSLAAALFGLSCTNRIPEQTNATVSNSVTADPKAWVNT